MSGVSLIALHFIYRGRVSHWRVRAYESTSLAGFKDSLSLPPVSHSYCRSPLPLGFRWDLGIQSLVLALAHWPLTCGALSTLALSKWSYLLL